MRDMPCGTKIQIGILVAISIGLPLGVAAWWLRARIANRTAPATPAARSQPARAAFQVGEAIYDGGLQPGWQARGWSRRELVDGGPARVSFDSFGGLSLQHERLPARFGALLFRIKAPPAFQEFLSVALLGETEDAHAFPRVAVTPDLVTQLAAGWSEVEIPLLSLDPGGKPFVGVTLQARRMVPADPVLLDKLVLTLRVGDTPTSAATKANRGFVTLDCRAEAKPISPLIYGIAAGVVSSGETAHRVGGNAMTRLNWDLGNTWNTGNDWFFENVKSDDGGLTSWLADVKSNGLQMALTVPTIGWVAKDAVSSGFPRNKLGAQRKYDEHRAEAGDGFSPDGTPLAPLPPTQTSEPAPPERIQRWVEEIRRRDQQGGGSRSVAIYMLDNEPDLWHATHRDIHPEPLSYDELLDRTLRYGAAVRKADPEALIAGPASWGWTGYFFSPKDTLAGALLQPDRRAHGGQPLLAWYLQKLAEHEHTTGERILDVLDVHYYPQADQVYSAKSDPETAARRVRSTRSLWDPTYSDESWIKEPVRLLPRLREWVDRYYPGRKISLGEWSFGGEQDISGGLATAEALGRFGQQGLFAAFYWSKPEPGSATYWAFRAFRNYDGKGAHFLDFSVKAASTERVSVFASRDANSSRLTLVLLNLDQNRAAELDFDVSSCGALQVARTFSYRGGEAGIAPDSAPPKAPSGLTLAPYSITIVELTKQL